MKTWEVYKYALENPKARFKKATSELIYFFKNGEPTFIDKYGTTSSSYDLIQLNDHEWEIVEEPVSWQEAMQAWIEDKNIRIEYGGETYKQSHANKLGCFKGNEKGFPHSFFRTGKWYIES